VEMAVTSNASPLVMIAYRSFSHMSSSHSGIVGGIWSRSGSNNGDYTRSRVASSINDSHRLDTRQNAYGWWCIGRTWGKE